MRGVKAERTPSTGDHQIDMDALIAQVKSEFEYMKKCISQKNQEKEVDVGLNLRNCTTLTR